MMKDFTIIISIVFLVCVGIANAAQEDDTSANRNTTTSKEKKLFAYAGSFLPSDWQVVTIVNDRAVVGFTNGSARNSLLVELEPRDRIFLEKLQNGTIYTTPLTSAKEKIAQWSSSVTSSVSKFGKSVKDQFDSFINQKKDPNAQKVNITETYITSTTN